MEIKRLVYENKITNILENSIAEELGINKGDSLISINNEKIEDIIEYNFLEVDEYIELEIKKVNGDSYIFEIEKDIDEPIGIEFENPIIDSVKTCNNKCIFCFIDQLPDNMRESLYFKDDDSRLSFLQGNFITMTNMGDREIEKIIKYRISPINISVHTTNPQLRVKMLGNRFALDIYDKMKRLKNAGIIMNAQIVLVPNINDKNELENTINDLCNLYPELASVAVVPVGITKYRSNLHKLDIFNKETSKEVINQISEIQEQLLIKLGTRFVFLSDEFYVTAQESIPVQSNYEGYIQLENGVGLISKFEHEIIDALSKIKQKKILRHVSIATGKSAFDFMTKITKLIEDKFEGLIIDVHMINNNFFGETITVSGLITGTDIINQLEHKNLYDALIIPISMMKSDENIFLDNISIKDLQERLNIPILVSKIEGIDFINKVTQNFDN